MAVDGCTGAKPSGDTTEAAADAVDRMLAMLASKLPGWGPWTNPAG
jgi:hypothetical protein